MSVVKWFSIKIGYQTPPPTADEVYSYFHRVDRLESVHKSLRNVLGNPIRGGDRDGALDALASPSAAAANPHATEALMFSYRKRIEDAVSGTLNAAFDGEWRNAIRWIDPPREFVVDDEDNENSPDSQIVTDTLNGLLVDSGEAIRCEKPLYSLPSWSDEELAAARAYVGDRSAARPAVAHNDALTRRLAHMLKMYGTGPATWIRKGPTTWCRQHGHDWENSTVMPLLRGDSPWTVPGFVAEIELSAEIESLCPHV